MKKERKEREEEEEEEGVGGRLFPRCIIAGLREERYASRRATTAARKKCNLSLRGGDTLDSSARLKGESDGRAIGIDGRAANTSGSTSESKRRRLALDK